MSFVRQISVLTRAFKRWIVSAVRKTEIGILFVALSVVIYSMLLVVSIAVFFFFGFFLHHCFTMANSNGQNLCLIKLIWLLFVCMWVFKFVCSRQTRLWCRQIRRLSLWLMSFGCYFVSFWCSWDTLISGNWYSHVYPCFTIFMNTNYSIWYFWMNLSTVVNCKLFKNQIYTAQSTTVYQWTTVVIIIHFGQVLLTGSLICYTHHDSTFEILFRSGHVKDHLSRFWSINGWYFLFLVKSTWKSCLDV